MSDDLAAQLVTAATEAVLQSWSPETEYDGAGCVAVLATLKALPKNAVISWPLPAGSPARTANVSVSALIYGIEQGDGK